MGDLDNDPRQPATPSLKGQCRSSKKLRGRTPEFLIQARSVGDHVTHVRARFE